MTITQLLPIAVALHPNANLRQWPRAILPAADHRQLSHHLDTCETSRLPAWALLAHVLHHKITSTEPVDHVHAPDLVTGGSRVSYAINDGAALTGLLSHRARDGVASGVIPVASLLGATLIGMRVGQRAPLLGDNGAIGRIRVLGVVQPD